MTTWAVFFDRDGVLTEATVRDGKAASPRSRTELVILPGAAAAVRRVHDAGARAIVVSNQPDVGRGLLLPAEVAWMNDRLKETVGVDDVLVCTHSGTEGCECRKPGHGLLSRAAAVHGIDLRRSWMIGDRWVDIAAGAGAGTSTILLARAYSWEPTSTAEAPPGLRPTATCTDVTDAVERITGPPERLEPCS